MRISDWSSDVCSSDLVDIAGDPSLAAGGSHVVGNIDGDTFSSPDGIRIDPQGRLWVQTDHSIPGNSGVAGTTIEDAFGRSEEHTSELQSLMRISYAVFCLNKKNKYEQKPLPTRYTTYLSLQ